MADYDVFNGDADGICALLQLRFAEPREAQLVTGVKREIDLLNRVYPAADDRITVLDISLDKNREGLNRALDVGAQVFYVDHHPRQLDRVVFVGGAGPELSAHPRPLAE